MALDWTNRFRTSGNPPTSRGAAPAAATVEPTAPARRRTDGRKPGATALGALLKDRGLLTEEQLATAIARQQKTGRRLGHIVVELGFVTADAVLEVLSEQMGVPTVRINAYTVHTDALAALPEK